MSTVTGSITVGVEFRDATTSSGVQSLNAIALRQATDYTTGKVAVLTGAAGFPAEVLWSASQGIGFGGYRNASGLLVSLSQVNKIVIRADNSPSEMVVQDADLNSFKLTISGNETAVSQNNGSAILISSVNGPAPFTAILYGT
jgi:hypothetical protein